MSDNRLPIPGSDDNDWGTILNNYLSVSLNTDGTLSTTALQQAGGVTSVNGQSPTNGAVSVTAADATGSAPGVVQLTGDLGGSATSPTVVATHLSSALPINQGGTGSTTQNFVDLSSNQAISGAKTFAAGTLIDNGNQFINAKAYGATGNGTTDDTTAIQNAIAALPANGGTVFLPPGTYKISATIAITADQRLIGAGTGATTITASTDILMIRMGNRQADSVMRNWMYLSDMTVSQTSGSQTHTNVLVDGGGQGTTIKNVFCEGGYYGFELMDVDRCYFENLESDNCTGAAIVLEVGKENTWGTATFLNCRAVLGAGNNNTYGFYVIANADQSSSYGVDRVSFINCHCFMTTGLTGCIGFWSTQEMTSTTFISCLFEQNNQHFRSDGSNSSVTFIGCTFLDSNVVCTDIAYLTAYGSYTFRDCRFQQATNVFHATANYPIVMLEGRNNNQGTLTNIWVGSFGYLNGTDISFAGAGGLALGRSGIPYSTLYTQAISGMTTPLSVGQGGSGANTLTGLVVGHGTSAMTAVTAPAGTVVGTSDTQTLTNKRITKRTGTTTSSATPAINSDNVDFYSITALATAITSFSMSGTPTENQNLWIAITDSGSAQSITWGSSFESSTVLLPSTTVPSTRMDIGLVWNTVTSKWRCVAVA